MREIGEEKADQVMAFTQMCRIVGLYTEIALAAADACRDRGLATADAIIYLTVQLNGAALLTCDAHFDGLPDVRFVPKPKPWG